MTGPEAIEILARLGLNGRDAARLLNVTENTIWRWRHDMNKPTGSSLRIVQLLDHLGEPLVYIIHGMLAEREAKSPLTADQATLLSIYLAREAQGN